MKRKRGAGAQHPRQWYARAPATGSETLSEALSRAKRERTRERDRALQSLRSASSPAGLAKAAKFLSYSLHVGFADSALLQLLQHPSLHQLPFSQRTRAAAEFANACVRASEPGRGLARFTQLAHLASDSYPQPISLAQFCDSPIPATILCKCFASAARLRDGLTFFKHLPPNVPNIRTLNALLRGCVWRGDGSLACKALSAASRRFHLQPDLTSYECAIKAVCSCLMVQKAQKLLSDCINAHGSATPPMQVALAQCLLACGSNPERIQHHIGKGRMLAEQQKTSHEGTSSIDKYKRFSSRDVLDECNFLEQALITRQTGFAESVRYDWRTDTCVAFRESSDEVLKLPSECSIHVELCSGNGDWAVKAVQSKRLPFVVVVENRIDRVFLTWHKIRRNSLTDRILLVCGDAKHVVANCLPAHSAQSITVNFPEPPVYAGAASRLVDEKFLLAVKHALVSEGRCTVVTDNAYYAIDMQRVLKKCEGLFKAEQSLSLGMEASTDCTYFDKLFSAGNRRDRFSLLLQK